MITPKEIRRLSDLVNKCADYQLRILRLEIDKKIKQNKG